jgi:hypothetical protein
MRGCLVAMLLLAGIILPASSALAAMPDQSSAGPGAIGIRLVGVPGGPANDPIAHLYVVGRVSPGSSIRRSVQISNTTRASADVTVYPAAASTVRGAFAFASGHSQNQLSGWTSVSRGVIRLPPGGKAFDTLTVHVPGDASSGERYAVLWAQVSAPSAAEGVNLVNRVGVRMYLSIGSGGAAAPNFAIGPLSAKRSATGQPLVAAQVRNTGHGPLEISGSLTLSDGPGGLSAGSVPARPGAVLAPGGSETVTVPLAKNLPRGPWRARLRLTSGQLQRSATATITFPRRADAGTTPKVPWLALAVILLLVLLAGTALALLISRRRKSGTRRHWTRHGMRPSSSASRAASRL